MVKSTGEKEEKEKEKELENSTGQYHGQFAAAAAASAAVIPFPCVWAALETDCLCSIVSAVDDADAGNGQQAQQP